MATFDHAFDPKLGIVSESLNHSHLIQSKTMIHSGSYLLCKNSFETSLVGMTKIDKVTVNIMSHM